MHKMYHSIFEGKAELMTKHLKNKANPVIVEICAENIFPPVIATPRNRNTYFRL
jgi:hypothetical protein